MESISIEWNLYQNIGIDMRRKESGSIEWNSYKGIKPYQRIGIYNKRIYVRV